MRVKLALIYLEIHGCVIALTMERCLKTPISHKHTRVRQTYDVFVGLKSAQWLNKQRMHCKTKQNRRHLRENVRYFLEIRWNT